MFCSKCNKGDKCTKICPEVNNELSNSGIHPASFIRPLMPSGDRQLWGKWREVPTPLIDGDISDIQIWDREHREGKRNRPPKD